MPVRALIVLLLILNLGVALWWATRETPTPVPPPSLAAGVEPLRLLAEPRVPDPSGTAAAGAGAAGAPVDAAMAAVDGDTTPDDAGDATPGDAATAPPPASDPLLGPAPPDPPSIAGSRRCRRFGPFPDAAAAERAADALRPSVQRLALRETRAAARGWDVRLAALPDRAAAEAMATRLVAAGFGDHYLLPAADDGSVDIALGRFGNEDSAQRHRGNLQAAGFEAVAAPIGEGRAQHWIHAALAAQADPAALQRAAGAAQATGIDCATLDAPDR